MWTSRSTGVEEKQNKTYVDGYIDASVSCANTTSTRIFRANNEIHFSDDINYDTVHHLIKMLKEVEQESMKHVESCKKAFVLSADEKTHVDLTITPKPILLYITTHGGSIYAALKAVDVIDKLEVPVHTIVTGYVASAGTLLSMAGKKRLISKHSFMLLHELRSSFWGKYSDARDQIENLDKIMDMITEFITEKSKIDSAELKSLLSRDRNWSVQECIEKGVVDQIL